jgi:hypothetical protein
VGRGEERRGEEKARRGEWRGEENGEATRMARRRGGEPKLMWFKDKRK